MWKKILVVFAERTVKKPFLWVIFNEEGFIRRNKETFNQVVVIKEDLKDEFLFKLMEKIISEVERIQTEPCK